MIRLSPHIKKITLHQHSQLNLITIPALATSLVGLLTNSVHNCVTVVDVLPVHSLRNHGIHLRYFISLPSPFKDSHVANGTSLGLAQPRHIEEFRSEHTQPQPMARLLKIVVCLLHGDSRVESSISIKVSVPY